MYRQPADFPPDGYSEIDGCREPGFREPFGRGFHCSFHCLHWKRILETNGGRSPRFRENQPPCFPARFPVRRERRFSKRSAGGAPGFKTIEPRFSVSFPFPTETRFSEPPEEGSGFCHHLDGFPGGRGLRYGPHHGGEPRVAPAAQRKPAIHGRQPDPGGPGGGLEGPAPAEFSDNGQGGGSGELRRSAPRIATNGHDRAPKPQPPPFSTILNGRP